ncbi:hypothetical protein STAS_35660 [Striga asiatica]|uniref:Uncharacterized protein n=1 Tax=Striga asiatica TaxID=4170 RepID=A0A5A7RL80_STRAF|nr:hypothetical protein STAS_35660 [Striga asiatica]
MSSANSSANGPNEVEIRGQSFDFASRHNLESTSVSEDVKGKENLVSSQDQETMARAKEKEILYLREQIALASIRESQMLNEKYTLERKFSELRMALDEKQSEVIASASNELARRKGDLEVNLNLLNELKVAEDERHIFTSSMLGILAEFGALPHVTNASALTNSIKHLHDQLQLKIRTSHARLAELNSMIGYNSRNGLGDKEIPGLAPSGGQFPSTSMGVRGLSHYSQYNDGKIMDPAHDPSRYVQENDSKQVKSLTRSSEMRQLPNNETLLRTLPNIDRSAASRIMDNMLERNGYPSVSEQRSYDQFSHLPMHENAGSFGAEGNMLSYLVTWVRHNPDGTRQYIEGATNPEYIVTADDVDKLIAVECIPMDEQGRQGDIVRIFANDQHKITCDDEMQEEIDTHISKGQAAFSVLILLENSENWEPASLLLRRSGFQVKDERKQDVIITEKYSKDLTIKIPSGFSTQFVLTCSNGSSYPFSTNNDIRMRDTLVLTIRIFQSKALDEKRKGKA